VALVTGASSGNGRGIALRLASEGAAVVCADLRPNALAGGYEPDIEIETDALIRQRGGKAVFQKADVRSAAEVEAAVARAVSEFGRLDLMVNNAGTFTGLHTVIEETEEEFQLTMDVNLKGAWLGCKYAIAQMLRQEPWAGGGRGRIVNIASVAALIALPREPAYCASKGAVVALSKQAALDFAQQSINVNVVAPGFIYTAMTRSAADTGFEAAIKQITPFPRLGNVSDVVGATLFLLSDDAAWITGTVLTVDGGASRCSIAAPLASMSWCSRT